VTKFARAHQEALDEDLARFQEREEEAREIIDEDDTEIAQDSEEVADAGKDLWEAECAVETGEKNVRIDKENVAGDKASVKTLEQESEGLRNSIEAIRDEEAAIRRQRADQENYLQEAQWELEAEQAALAGEDLSEEWGPDEWFWEDDDEDPFEPFDWDSWSSGEGDEFGSDVSAGSGNQLDPNEFTNDFSEEWIGNEDYFPDDNWDDFYPDTFYTPEVGPDEWELGSPGLWDDGGAGNEQDEYGYLIDNGDVYDDDPLAAFPNSSPGDSGHVPKGLFPNGVTFQDILNLAGVGASLLTLQLQSWLDSWSKPISDAQEKSSKWQQGWFDGYEAAKSYYEQQRDGGSPDPSQYRPTDDDDSPYAEGWREGITSRQRELQSAARARELLEKSGLGNYLPGSGGVKTNAPKMSNKEATAAAQDLGYSQRVAPPKLPFNSHGQPGFFDGKKYITQDIDGHKGGVWKMYTPQGKRLGTFDAQLNRIGD
jgi:hypothetical protein